ncbi:hypothetical protein [Vibrio parahaemolyticus]|uniref:hypothetical protein n=1 Tax=Vibrio parahaemolyticus TaxID=670 RepID=UPI001F17A293|nr:hypothetical protein [Vibrio parahaemolyticus]UJW92709.1 hypothetical protein JHS83_24730 [Vibrio parahaemolyticus]WCZ09730.1 hypothetical protein GSR97_26060 [Vibrio parahaemolyticus]
MKNLIWMRSLLPPNKNPTEAIQSQKEIEAAVKTLEQQIEDSKNDSQHQTRHSWLRYIKRKIFLGSQQEENVSRVPTTILGNSQEYALEDIELMGIPVLSTQWTTTGRQTRNLT